MAIRRPGLPAVSNEIPKNIRDVLQPLVENVQVANGVVGGTGVNQAGWKRRSVTLGMLIKYGVITEAVARQMYEED